MRNYDPLRDRGPLHLTAMDLEPRLLPHERAKERQSLVSINEKFATLNQESGRNKETQPVTRHKSLSTLQSLD